MFENSVNRRDFLNIARRYGGTATLLGAASIAGPFTAIDLARAAESEEKKRASVTPKFKLKHGSSMNETRLRILTAGHLEFVRDLEARTDGAIQVEFFPDGQFCGEVSCMRKAQQGIVDLFSVTTQNCASGAPYYSVLDFPYLFPSRASMHHFLYHTDSEKLLRKPLRENHKVEFLFSHCELRDLNLGLGWQNRTISKLDDVKGSKIRVTASQFGAIALGLLGVNPVPVAWAETLDGLKSGLLDGAETFSSAVAQAGLSPVISKVLSLQFFAGMNHTAMRSQVFDKLGSDLQEAVFETSYYCQSSVQRGLEASLVNTVGATTPPLEGTIFKTNNTEIITLPPEELTKAEGACSPQSKPEPWESWRERLNRLAGGTDVYSEIHRVAREIPDDTLAENVVPKRWWKS